ncbi:PqqD family peptide modification chaperone [Microbacterium sufflavum]
MDSAGEGSASPRRRVLDVAGAFIAVEVDRGDEDRAASLLRGWADAVAPGGAAVDRTLFLAELTGADAADLRAAVFTAARRVLADRDVWAPEATLLVDDTDGGDRAVLVLGGAAAAFPPGAHHGGFVSRGRTLVAVDPLGTLRPCAAPVPTADGPVAPSAVDARTEAPARLRLAGVLLPSTLADDAVPPEDATPVALDRVLPALAAAAPPFPGARDPLRSLARLVAHAGVAELRSPDDDDAHAALAALAHGPRGLGHRALPVAEPLTAASGEARLHRAGATDALVTEGGRVVALTAHDGGTVVVLDGGTVVVLDAAESAVWTGDADAVASAEVPAAVARLLDRGLLSADPGWRIADHATWADHGASTVALDLSTPAAAPLALRDSAQSVWHVLVQRRAVQRTRLLDELAAQYGVEPAVVADDVDALLASLERARLVVRP